MRLDLWAPEEDSIPDQIMTDVLTLVGIVVPDHQIASWTRFERLLAYDWAMREHASASDNRNQRRECPSFVLPDSPDGHELWHAIVTKHGVDRYPRPPAQFRKLLEEIGELGESLIVHGHSPATIEVRKELGDVGLSLHGLSVKLGLNLGECMAEVVEHETRKFDGTKRTGT